MHNILPMRDQVRIDPKLMANCLIVLHRYKIRCIIICIEKRKIYLDPWL